MMSRWRFFFSCVGVFCVLGHEKRGGAHTRRVASLQTTTILRAPRPATSLVRCASPGNVVLLMCRRHVCSAQGTPGQRGPAGQPGCVLRRRSGVPPSNTCSAQVTRATRAIRGRWAPQDRRVLKGHPARPERMAKTAYRRRRSSGWCAHRWMAASPRRPCAPPTRSWSVRPVSQRPATLRKRRGRWATMARAVMPSQVRATRRTRSFYAPSDNRTGPSSSATAPHS